MLLALLAIFLVGVDVDVDDGAGVGVGVDFGLVDDDLRCLSRGVAYVGERRDELGGEGVEEGA